MRRGRQYSHQDGKENNIDIEVKSYYETNKRKL